MTETILKQIKELSFNEKLILFEELRDSIISDPESVSLPDFHRTIIDERLKTFDEDKENGTSWGEFKKRYI